MPYKKTMIVFSFILLLISTELHSQKPEKKIPQEGYISNYNPLENLWRAYNCLKGNNRKNDILEAIRTNNKEAFKENFMEGDLAQQGDIVIEIILNNNIEFLRVLDEEMNIDIEAVVMRYELQHKIPSHELPRQLALRQGSHAYDMFLYLQEHGFWLNANDENGDTVALVALEKEDKVLFSSLLGTIIDPNKKNYNSETLMHKAAYLDDNDYLLATLKTANKAALNSKDASGQTPLHIATKKNDPKKIEALIQHGANVSIGDHDGVTPAHLAASGQCSPQCAKTIFNAPTMDPHVTTNDGTTVQQTLKKTHHRTCLKKIGNMKTKEEIAQNRKSCNQIISIYNFFKQSQFARLKSKTQKLIEEQNSLFEQQALMSKEEFELRKQAIQEELKKIEEQEAKINENLVLQRTQLNGHHELVECLAQELSPNETHRDHLDFQEGFKEKLSDDSHKKYSTQD